MLSRGTANTNVVFYYLWYDPTEDQHATLCGQGDHADTIGGGLMLFSQ